VTGLDVNGVRQLWLLDTGANFSVVSDTFARRLGLKPLPGYAYTGAGVTGIENRLQASVLPALSMGGAILRNVVVLILPDANLNVGPPNHTYQIQAIIGYPVFHALGTVTFRDGWFQAGGAGGENRGAPMYMRLMDPIILCKVEGAELPFTFDTGAAGSNLSVRYYDEFRLEAGSWKRGETESGGAGGVVKRAIYVQPSLDLHVGEQTATITKVPIFTRVMGSEIDELFGNLGLDLTSGFQSFTLDFIHMSFSLGPPLTEKSN